jgi:hypothetical protein
MVTNSGEVGTECLNKGTLPNARCACQTNADAFAGKRQCEIHQLGSMPVIFREMTFDQRDSPTQPLPVTSEEPIQNCFWFVPWSQLLEHVKMMG